MITKENTGEMLLEHRENNKLTQMDVSEKTGVTVQTLCLIEGGKTRPQSMTFRKIKRYLDTFKTVDNG